MRFNTIVVVLYNMNVLDAPTIRSILSYMSTLESSERSLYRLILWDNSEHSDGISTNHLAETLHPCEVEFIHTPKNLSLSYIYNQVAKLVDIHEYLTLFDQDTDIPNRYFTALLEAQRQDYNLILPIVICKDTIVSPGSRFMSRGKLLKEVQPGLCKSHRLLAINSGMSIQGQVLRKVNYDERLRFYGTDTYFMRNYEKHFLYAFVLDVKLNHALAEMESRPPEWHIAHQIERIRILWIVFSNSRLEKAFTFFYSTAIWVKMKIRSLNRGRN